MTGALDSPIWVGRGGEGVFDSSPGGSRSGDPGGLTEVLCVADAAAGAERKDWWPQSPKQEEMCKTQ